jgi:hypothetical protein
MAYSPMTPKKAAAYLTVAILLAAWFASAVSVSRQARAPRQPSASASDEARLEALAADVQAQSSRLRERLAAAPRVQTPTRNPFMFRPRETPVPNRMVRAAIMDPQPAAELEFEPREPLLVLVGVAEEKTKEGLVRTAMISDEAEELHMAVQGQHLLGRYVVEAVSPDAVELKDITTGVIRRLALR